MCILRSLPNWHLGPMNPDGQEQLPSTQVPPFRQGLSLKQTKQQNKWCLTPNKSSKNRDNNSYIFIHSKMFTWTQGSRSNIFSVLCTSCHFRSRIWYQPKNKWKWLGDDMILRIGSRMHFSIWWLYEATLHYYHKIHMSFYIPLYKIHTGPLYLQYIHSRLWTPVYQCYLHTL